MYCIAGYLQQIIRTQATSNLILRDIKERISNLEDAYKSRIPSTKGSDSFIAEIVPLQTVESIENFDSLLRDSDQAVTQFVSFYINL